MEKLDGGRGITRHAGDRRGWGLALEAIIDRLFVLIGEAPGHCRRNVETAFAGKVPIA